LCRLGSWVLTLGEGRKWALYGTAAVPSTKHEHKTGLCVPLTLARPTLNPEIQLWPCPRSPFCVPRRPPSPVPVPPIATAFLHRQYTSLTTCLSPSRHFCKAFAQRCRPFTAFALVSDQRVQPSTAVLPLRRRPSPTRSSRSSNARSSVRPSGACCLYPFVSPERITADSNSFRLNGSLNGSLPQRPR
jgi:hypothetical protein